MSEQNFFVRKLGLGKEVVSLSLVATEVAISGRWNEKTGGWFANIVKKGPERLLHLVSMIRAERQIEQIDQDMFDTIYKMCLRPSRSCMQILHT